MEGNTENGVRINNKTDITIKEKILQSKQDYYQLVDTNGNKYESLFLSEYLSAIYPYLKS